MEEKTTVITSLNTNIAEVRKIRQAHQNGIQEQRLEKEYIEKTAYQSRQISRQARKTLDSFTQKKEEEEKNHEEQTQQIWNSF